VKLDEQKRSNTLAGLREAFDRSFAQAPALQTARSDEFLAVRVGGDPYAIRLSDIAALHRDRKVVSLPNRDAELLGIAGFRGMLAPVYDLAALLGYGHASAPRWLVLARGRAAVGLAFDLFEVQLRVARDNVSAEDGEQTRRHVRGAVRAGHVVRPLIHIASVLEAIARRVHSDGPPKEL
jgi:chemotaxis signal transduction protein